MTTIGEYAKHKPDRENNSLLQPLLSTYSVSSHGSRAGGGDGASHHVSLIHSAGLAPVVKVPPPGTPAPISKLRARFYVAIFLILVFLGASLFSIIAPFFPNRAMEKGIHQTTAGIIIGIMELSQFFASILFAFTIFHFGLKFLLISGIVCASCCNILFGILDLSPPGSAFTVLCFLVRFVEGTGICAYYISCFTMSAILFTENYGFVVGLLETAIALGYLLGPTIGGAIYSAGGYMTPFVVLGLILVSFAPVVYFTIPANIGTQDQNKESPVRVFKVMFKPALIIVLYTITTTTMTSVFTETTLGVRLAQFGIDDPLIVGFVYLSSSGAFSIAAPIAGRIADKLDLGWLVMIVGIILSVLGYLIVGPSPIFGDIVPASVVQLVIGCILAHTGLAAVQIPASRELQRQASVYGLDPDHPTTLSFISAVYECTWGMGGFLGALLAGVLMENLGFAWATTIQAFIVLSCLFLQIYPLYKFGIIKHLKAKFSRAGYQDV